MSYKDRGFGSLIRTEEGRVRQKEIASKGGRAAQEKGTAHRWSPLEAKEAGRKGGQQSAQAKRRARLTLVVDNTKKEGQ